MTITQNLPNPAEALTKVLEWLEERLDLTHTASVEEHQRRALNWEPIEHPPVTIAAPATLRFPYYPYSQAFRDPVKMLVNELVDASAGLAPVPSVVNSVLLKDDFPLQIRANYGVGLIASLFGAKVNVVEDNFPWTTPIGPQRMADLLERGLPDLNGGLYPRVLDTMAYYREAMAPYPRCNAAIHITQPDLQGPFDIATQLWGGEIFTAFYDCPDFLREVLDFVAETYIMVCQAVSPHTTQAAGDGFIYLHWSICKGGCLLKDDSSTMLSPATYKEFIRPVNEKILTTLGGGGIHWCGSGDHWRKEFVETRGLTTADISQPQMIDLWAWAQSLSEHKVAASRMNFDVADYYSMKAADTFPTGAAFMVTVDSLDEGQHILDELEGTKK